MVDVNTRSFYAEKFRVMTSSVSECDTKNTDLSKLGSYGISDLFCPSIVINAVIVTTGSFKP